MATDTLRDLKRKYFISALGLPADTQMSIIDLEYAFFKNPPSGGGGGDPTVGGDLSGTASNAQIIAGAVGTTELAALAVTDAKVAAANKDGVAGTPSMRTLGTGSQQAAAGNDSRITGAEQASNKNATNGYAGLSGGKVAYSQLPTGTGASTVAAGDDSRITGSEQTANKNAASGYAGLSGGKIAYSQLPTGTTTSTVAAGDDSRITGAQQTTAKDQNSGYAGLDSSGLLSIARLPAGSTITVRKSGSWPARPTARTDIIVRWVGAKPSPSIVSSGTGGMMDNVDERLIV